MVIEMFEVGCRKRRLREEAEGIVRGGIRKHTRGCWSRASRHLQLSVGDLAIFTKRGNVNGFISRLARFTVLSERKEGASGC